MNGDATGEHATPTQLLVEADDRFKVIFQTFPRRFSQKISFYRRFSQKIVSEGFPRRFFQEISDPDSTIKNDKQTDLDGTSRFSIGPMDFLDDC